MLLISPCAVVVCGPRWALPQSEVRLVSSGADFRHYGLCRLSGIGAGFPAVLPVVVVGFPNPTSDSGGN
jgi:hypothetical protein